MGCCVHGKRGSNPLSPLPYPKLKQVGCEQIRGDGVNVNREGEKVLSGVVFDLSVGAVMASYYWIIFY